MAYELSDLKCEGSKYRKLQGERSNVAVGRKRTVRNETVIKWECSQDGGSSSCMQNWWKNVSKNAHVDSRKWHETLALRNTLGRYSICAR